MALDARPVAQQEPANVLGAQFGEINGAISELLSQQAPHDQSTMTAGNRRQPSYIAQVLIVTAQLIGEITTKHR
jgi:hypothetical protein